MSYRELLQSRTFRSYLKEIKDRLDEQAAIARSESDTVKIFRAQGAAVALESILEFPEDQAKNEVETRSEDPEAEEED